MTISHEDAHDIKAHPNDLILCADGRPRPRWASRGTESWRYFDEEWGRPPGTDSQWCEALALTVFQLGLTWHAVLNKREALRAAFGGFHVEHVASLGAVEVERLVGDPGIIRNRRKIEAVITNARALAALTEPLGQILSRYGNSGFVDDDGTIPTTTAASEGLSRELKTLGFTHIGPTAAFSLMQATGVIPIRGHYDLNR
ncbi:DNA-3-methyladenine glycosylase 1 [Corynebacterium faecale]|uniref:DNA-3-methyladenine glycosylase I n=1 Tax=Corynebacterium faecale TaxID=1758466 RepID=UPI0025B41499|nr:DNA-3-methyladenine glycosylase I [Corynebacterium faecale]WJY90998.1 DNA-3-methyladenine glycosylase 1 [Corynebacterium faecale]